MSDMDINQVLAQMRAISAKAQSTQRPETELDANGVSFGDLLSESIEQVNATQQHASQLAQAFEAGEPGVDLPEVMIALQKASLSFQAMTQVRNKLLSAYQEIMNMPV